MKQILSLDTELPTQPVVRVAVAFVALSWIFLTGVSPCVAQEATDATCTPVAELGNVCGDPLGGSQNVRLERGKLLVRALDGGAVHSYVVPVEKDDFVRVIVNQRGVDVTLKIEGPGNGMSIDTPLGRYGSERASSSATSSGTFRVEVRAFEGQKQGCYEVVLESLGPQTARDERQLEGDRFFAAAANKAPAARTTDGFKELISNYESALTHFRAAGDEYGEASALSGAAFQYGRLAGGTDKGLEYFGLALPIWQRLGDRRREAQALNNSGTLYLHKRQLGLALDCYLRSLPLWCATGERLGEAAARNNVASIYTEVGDHRKALVFYEQTLKILRVLPDTESQQAVLLNNIGLSYVALKSPEKAVVFYSDSLKIRQSLQGGDPLGVARVRNNIAIPYITLGRLDEAEKELEESLRIRREREDKWGEAASIYGLGLVRRARGEWRAALDLFSQALAIHQVTKDRLREATTLHAMADVENSLDDLGAALRHSATAVDIVEEQRRDLSNEELRTAYLTGVQEFYRLYIDLLMRMHEREPGAGHDRAAFKVSERARARMFLDLLTGARINFRNGVDSQLAERERSLSAALNVQATRYSQLVGGKHTPEQEADAKNRLESLRTELQQARARIRQASPKYAELIEPRVTGVEELQREVLEDGTAILEYAFGKHRSYLWMITKTSVTGYVLAGSPSEIEREARRYHSLLSERGREKEDESHARLKERIARADSEAQAVGASLSRMLLDPVADRLGRNRLIIIPDGVLQYIPFAALPVPAIAQAGGGSSGGGGANKRRGTLWGEGAQPLILRNEIVTAPSGSVLATLVKGLSERDTTTKGVAIIADPVYSAEDRRIKALARASAGKPTGEPPRPARADALLDPRRSADESAAPQKRKGFRRLSSSRWEAQQIYELAPVGSRLLKLDFEASGETARSRELSNYQVVHFSAHGTIDDLHPELSAIVLSLVDAEGRPTDGYLRLHDIFNLSLPAELVTLNACETGLGEEVQGEGLVGLTRGFMYAGSARVMVTLWPMLDRGAATFSVQFYKNLLGKNKKLSPSAALRETQKLFVTDPKFREWSHPYFWSGYVLTGN